MKLYTLFLSMAFLTACSSTSQETKIVDVFTLNKNHQEISGMIYHSSKQKLWMLEDKGNPAELYVYAPDGTLEQTIAINNQKNTDWEDLSQDVQGNIYIGDFGNNDNNRQDLKILKIKYNDLSNKSIDISQTTTFYYEDQQDFPPKKSNLIYDCEAFIATEDTFYLFTKNRSKGFDGTFSVYKIPNQEGHFKAEKIATLNSCQQYKGCAITGAALNTETNQVALVTHDKVLLIPFTDEESFVQENIQIKELGHYSQKESVTFKNNNELLIADEKKQKKWRKGLCFEIELKPKP